MSTVAADADTLNDLRGWYFEAFLTDHPDATYQESLDAVSDRVKEFGGKYDLYYVED